MQNEKHISLMTCEDFYDTFLHDNEGFQQLMSEMYWENTYSTERLLEFMTSEAVKLEIELVDSSEWEYDRFFHNVYRNYEKN